MKLRWPWPWLALGLLLLPLALADDEHFVIDAKTDIHAIFQVRIAVLFCCCMALGCS